MTSEEKVEENRVVRERLRARKPHVNYVESHSDDCESCSGTTEDSGGITEDSSDGSIITEDSSYSDSESQGIQSSETYRSASTSE